MSKIKNLPAEKSKRDTVSLLNDEFISQFKAEVDEFNRTGKRFTELTLRNGLRLEFAKENLPHGQLNKWIEDHTGISVRHARRCRDLAKVFINARKIKPGEVFALVDPANSQKELAKKLEQMAFDFIADKSQAELFAEYGIAVREPKKLGGARSCEKDPNLSLAQLKRLATEVINGLQHDLQRYCLEDRTRKLHLLAPTQLKSLEADLVSALLHVRTLLKGDQ